MFAVYFQNMDHTHKRDIPKTILAQAQTGCDARSEMLF